MKTGTRLSLLLLTSFVSCLAVAHESRHGIEFTESPIRVPFGADTYPASINDRNAVAGSYITGYGDEDSVRVFVLSPRHGYIDYRPLRSTPQTFDFATDINNRGVVVGYSQDSSTFESRAVRWLSADQVEDLGVAGAFGQRQSSSAGGINKRGHIVGGTTSSDHPLVAFLWKQPANMELLGTLGGTSSFATDINDRGTVVGASTTASGDTRAFRWTRRHGMQDLGVLPGGINFRAEAVNNRGYIVGYYRRGECDRLFLWTPRAGMKDLSGDGCGYASDINDWGIIAGARLVRDEINGFLIPNAAVWDVRGRTLDLSPPLPDEGSRANGLNNRGISVGEVGIDLEFMGVSGAKWTPVVRWK